MIVPTVNILGRKAVQKTLRWKALRFKKKMRSKLREAARITRKEIRRQIRAKLNEYSERKAAPLTKVVIKCYIAASPFKRSRAYAVIRPSKISVAYMWIHEEGATVLRKNKQVAVYAHEPTYGPAVRAVSGQVIRLLGRPFRVL